MTSFLFWNTCKNDVTHIISKLASLHRPDVVILAESKVTASVLLKALNHTEVSYDYIPLTGCTKLELFTRLPTGSFHPIFETARTTIQHVTLSPDKQLLLVATHLPSKKNFSDDSQIFECVTLANDIRNAESAVGHSQTVLVGDLNMNPFEDGMVATIGLHAIMSKKIAAKLSRTVQGRSYKFFYNPMWNLLGDESDGPPGTYYYGNAEHKVYFWNTFDQVLIRPELVDHFNFSDLRVIEEVGDLSLANASSGIPDKKRASDHFPLMFRISM